MSWRGGSTIDFWADRWCGEKALQLAYPGVYDTVECKSAKVKDCFGSDGWNWNVILGGDGVVGQGLYSTSTELKDLISTWTGSVSTSPDKILWRWDPGGGYSVKSPYSMLTDGGTIEAQGSRESEGVLLAHP